MGRKRAYLTATAIAAAAVCAPAVNASPVSTYYLTTYLTPGGVQTPVTTYVGFAGVSLTIPIYLFANDSGAVSMITGDEGLYQGGFSVTQTSGSGIITSVAGSTTSNGDTWGATGTVNAPNTNNSSFVQLAEFNLGYSASSPIVPNANNEIELGSVTFMPTAPGAYMFSLNSYAAGAPDRSDNATYNSGYDLDLTDDANNLTLGPSGDYIGTTANPETFTVTVASVPEPATVGLITVASLGLLARGRRRFR
jgi:hypothetical protein